MDRRFKGEDWDQSCEIKNHCWLETEITNDGIRIRVSDITIFLGGRESESKFVMLLVCEIRISDGFGIRDQNLCWF